MNVSQYMYIHIIYSVLLCHVLVCLVYFHLFEYWCFVESPERFSFLSLSLLRKYIFESVYICMCIRSGLFRLSGARYCVDTDAEQSVIETVYVISRYALYGTQKHIVSYAFYLRI